MSFVQESIAVTLGLLYGQAFPTGYESILILLAMYLVHLIVSAVILTLAIRLVGSKTGWIGDFPKALFTVFIRDILLIPLLLIVIFIPIIGLIIAFLIWFGLIKYMFKLTWVQALIAFIISIVIWVLVLLFVIIPILSLVFQGSIPFIP